MKEYDEEAAMKQMMSASGAGNVDENTAAEVLDLIFDYYDENGDLDINSAFDDDDDQPDVAAMVAYVQRFLRNSCRLADEQVEAMILAELDYEESLL